jgi:hypothetical protein
MRANALEAIWGEKAPRVVDLFQQYLGDRHNRVVGNSVIGLHRAGEHDVQSVVRRIAADRNPQFRMTAAWTMGAIRAPQFADLLPRLIRDDSPAVRSAALRAIQALRRIEKRTAGAASYAGW